MTSKRAFIYTEQECVQVPTSARKGNEKFFKASRQPPLRRNETRRFEEAVELRYRPILTKSRIQKDLPSEHSAQLSILARLRNDSSPTKTTAKKVSPDGTTHSLCQGISATSKSDEQQNSGGGSGSYLRISNKPYVTEVGRKEEIDMQARSGGGTLYSV